MSKSTTQKWIAFFNENIEESKIEWEEYQRWAFSGAECESEIEKLMLAGLMFCGFRFFQRPHRICKNVSSQNMDALLLLEHVIIAPQHKIGKYRADFAVFIKDFSGDIISLMVECDGHAFHEKTKEQAARDKKRDRYLQSAGFRVFRFTGSEIFNDIDGCISELSEFVGDLVEKTIPGASK